MVKQLKNRKLTSLIAVAFLALGFSVSGTVHADTTDNSTSSVVLTKEEKNMQADSEAHKDLQAYQNPLTAQELTAEVGQLPDAQAGIANWDSLPAGTTAVWNMKPQIDQVGRSYGQVIVTFPDGSASALAVYVDVQDKANSVEVKDEDSDQATSPVVIKDVKTKKNAAKETTAPKTESSEISNETAHVAGDSQLPQTSAKSVMASMIAGLMMAVLSVALIAKSLIKTRN